MKINNLMKAQMQKLFKIVNKIHKIQNNLIKINKKVFIKMMKMLNKINNKMKKMK